MSNGESIYSIREVADMLGIQPGTLRAWERRYQIIAPKRNEAGHRLYSENHVEILKGLIFKINQGFTISQAISFLEKKSSSKEVGEVIKGNNQVGQLSEQILKALMQFNEQGAHELINQAFSVFTLDKVLEGILNNLLAEITILWKKGKITTAHEHFASSILRARIGNVLQSFPINPNSPKFMAVCGPGEWHELELLIFTFFLRIKGYRILYLGPFIAEKDFEKVIEIVEPRYLFLSCTLKDNLDQSLHLAEKLSVKNESLSIGIGGYAINTLTNAKKAQYSTYIIGSDWNNWEVWLKKH